jgi:hypothetical protein
MDHVHYSADHIFIEEVRITDKDLPESGPVQNPRAIAVDARGSVYVTDFEADHIKDFKRAGFAALVKHRIGQ